MTWILCAINLACGGSQASPNASGTAEHTAPPTTPATSRFQLKASLFPWVPGDTSYVKWIEQEFERSNPTIDLVVRDLAKSHDWKPSEYVGDLSYEWEKTSQALTDTTSPDFQHVVEVDTMILGELVKRNAVLPLTIPDPGFLRFTRQAVRVNGTTYGVPHWTCGHFFMSNLPQIKTASSLDQVLRTLTTSGRAESVDVAGDMDGSWDSVMLYLDAYVDAHPTASAAEATTHSKLDKDVEANLTKVGRACTHEGKNHCGGNAAEAFAAGRVDTLFGYSEQLHDAVREGADPDNVTIVPATLGQTNRLLLFTDALVLSPQCSSAECQDAAAKFATFYTDARVYETVLLSRDGDQHAKPRYLLPATQAAFERPDVQADPIYSQLQRYVDGADAYPNEGVPAAKQSGVLRRLVANALGIEKGR
ncbi:extracellular solute-binding protein [Sorangium sp. So ce1078]|uniref:extracellular solute-binding protein n=1 Tax=Sorangium sp. So ce1078 TaxID=3133329 RepID=UPI003F61841F